MHIHSTHYSDFTLLNVCENFYATYLCKNVLQMLDLSNIQDLKLFKNSFLEVLEVACKCIKNFF